MGEAHEMNYKKVMRYLRLNSLVPELLDKVDDKKMGFMPAVEIVLHQTEKPEAILLFPLTGSRLRPRWPRLNGSGSWIRKASSTAMSLTVSYQKRKRRIEA